MGRQLKIVLKINMSQAPAFNREVGEQGGEEWNGVSCEGSAGNKHEPNARTAPAFNREGGQQGGEEWNGVSCEGSTENKHEPRQPSRSLSLSIQAPAFNREGGEQGGEEQNGVACEGTAVMLTLAFNPGYRFQLRGWTAGWRGVERSFLRGVSRSLSLSTQAPGFNCKGGEQGGEGVDGQLGPGPFLYAENWGQDLRPRIPNKYLVRARLRRRTDLCTVFGATGPHRQNTQICPQKPRICPTPIGTPIPPCLLKSGGAAPGLLCIDAMGGTVESREEVKEYAASGQKVPGGKDLKINKVNKSAIYS
ncbi:hypothetical protein B0H11DRAFT_1944241 [Mycena galericulata]|nr:hypothetical protein B0H11DRAFT_1944241 [Mycena galericulata]